ncbi:hypothetical protein [Mycobacterium sp.]|uniref:hypothetical protein n=1 Tax=Mycobacterium sp. TaxID=1785 RepID=UPI003D138FFD
MSAPIDSGLDTLRPVEQGSGFSERGHRRGARPVLVQVLLAALATNVETTVVNVALPTLNTGPGPSTRDGR